MWMTNKHMIAVPHRQSLGKYKLKLQESIVYENG